MKSTVGLKTYSQDYVMYDGTDVGKVATGWTNSTITSSSYVCYKLVGNRLHLCFFIQGTSNSTAVVIKLYPYNRIDFFIQGTSASAYTGISAVGRGSNNGGAYIAGEIVATPSLDCTTINVYNGPFNTGFTAAGSKTVSGEIMLPVNL